MNKGFLRDKDGQLLWQSGIGSHYTDYGESMKLSYRLEAGFVCTEGITNRWSHVPCSKPAKHDPDKKGNPTKCGMHCADAKLKRANKQAATRAKWNLQWETSQALSKVTAEVESSLRLIALGHNDPRALALDVITRLDAARKANTEAHQKETK